jgi:hypothetical protein
MKNEKKLNTKNERSMRAKLTGFELGVRSNFIADIDGDKNRFWIFV